MAEKRKLETPEQANNGKRKAAEKMAEIRKLETPEQANIWKRKTAEKMAEKRKLETAQQHQNRIEKIFDRKNPITQEGKKFLRCIVNTKSGWQNKHLND